jgi:hypothetical protein
MLIFNKRLLCKCKSVSERNSVINKLKDAGIEFQCKAKGTNSRIVATIQDIFWFNIYVNKYDYEKATKIL